MGVTHRFVGTEPFCRVTASTTGYALLAGNARTISAPPIELVEIERLRLPGDADIRFPGTSTAGKNNLTAIAPLVLQDRAALFATCLSTPPTRPTRRKDPA
ncbi:hypothetical protein ACLK1S_03890 [Escherichia coli]